MPAGSLPLPQFVSTSEPNAFLRMAGEGTTAVLIVAEALHDTAPADMERLTEAVSDGLSAIWSATAKAAILSSSAPRFDF